jgi:hypothetical protein
VTTLLTCVLCPALVVADDLCAACGKRLWAAKEIVAAAENRCLPQVDMFDIDGSAAVLSFRSAETAEAFVDCVAKTREERWGYFVRVGPPVPLYLMGIAWGTDRLLPHVGPRKNALRFPTKALAIATRCACAEYAAAAMEPRGVVMEEAARQSWGVELATPEPLVSVGSGAPKAGEAL